MAESGERYFITKDDWIGLGSLMIGSLMCLRTRVMLLCVVVARLVRV